jgi:hypothetical protein
MKMPLESRIIQVSKDAYDLNDPNKLVEFFLQQSYEDIRMLFYNTKCPIIVEGDVSKMRYIAFLMLYYYYNCHSGKIVWEDADGNVQDIEMNAGFVSMKNHWSNVAFYGTDRISVIV